MIIELFGPPGAGKTTFTLALAARLRERGHTVEVVLSYRPAERLARVGSGAAKTMSAGLAAAMRRLARPLFELLALARHPFVSSQEFRTAVTLLKILPPRNMMWAVRLSQYISRLSHAWFQVVDVEHIVLFDQAYVQVLCSLAVVGRVTVDALLARALDATPKADLLIRLDAPIDVLKTRLCERQQLQGTIERLFEFDLQRNLDSVKVIDRLYDLMRRNGRAVICASSLDPMSLPNSVDRIEQQLQLTFALQRTGTER